jgi:transcription-repair coupling factor (superfamily II helicase)
MPKILNLPSWAKRILRHAFARAIAVILLNTVANAAFALTFGDVGNLLNSASSFLTDPLKLGASSSNILQSIREIREALGPIQDVETKTNTDVEARLNQVARLLAQAQEDVANDMQHADQILQRTLAQVKGLETEIFDRSEALIEQVRCVGVDWTNVQLRTAIKEVAASIAQAHPGIKLLGYKVLSINVDKVEVANAYAAYQSLKQQILKDLDALPPDAPIQRVHEGYGNIQRAARDAICIYAHTGTEKDLYHELAYFKGLEDRWTWISRN